MSRVTYTYEGPPSGVTLPDGQEVILHPGKEVELDPANTYTQALVAQGRLKAVPVVPAEPEAPKKGGKA